MTLKEELVEIIRAKSIGSVWRSVDDVAAEVASFIESREETERERVKTALIRLLLSRDTTDALIRAIYPPKVEILPAGWYAVKTPASVPFPEVHSDAFPAIDGWEYRPIKNPFEE